VEKNVITRLRFKGPRELEEPVHCARPLTVPTHFLTYAAVAARFGNVASGSVGFQ
jgi:hypothetical protein